MADPFSLTRSMPALRSSRSARSRPQHVGNHRRVPLDGGTALEHLAKACLALRSPALLAELKNDSSVGSLIGLLRIEGAGAPAKIRTVGLTEALSRIGRFVRSKAAKDDLQTLVDVRNGIVHAAEDTEGEAVVSAVRTLSKSVLLAGVQRFRACPVCDSHAVATGGHTVEWVPDDWDKETGQVTNV